MCGNTDRSLFDKLQTYMIPSVLSEEMEWGPIEEWKLILLRRLLSALGVVVAAPPPLPPVCFKLCTISMDARGVPSKNILLAVGMYGGGLILSIRKMSWDLIGMFFGKSVVKTFDKLKVNWASRRERTLRGHVQSRCFGKQRSSFPSRTTCVEACASLWMHQYHCHFQRCG